MCIRDRHCACPGGCRALGGGGFHQDRLRVRPISSSRNTEFSQHEANGCEAQEDQAAEVGIFPVLGKPAATIAPRNGALDEPSARQNDEAFGLIGTLDDFGFESSSD